MADKAMDISKYFTNPNQGSQKRMKVSHVDSKDTEQDDSHMNKVDSFHQNCQTFFPGLNIDPGNLKWTKICKNHLNLHYAIALPAEVATSIFDQLESEIEYFTGELSRVRVFGKWFNIPRKQASFGDPGLKYTFSGVTVPARPWLPVLAEIRDLVEKITNCRFNFLLINRYKDGHDYIGEHKDDEKDMQKTASIVSLSFGQERDFVFRHQDLKLKKKPKEDCPEPFKMKLEHGSILVMKYPTNHFWYHSLPVQKTATRPRINLTFRFIVPDSSPKKSKR